jgi:hypothetical protein
MIITRYSKNIVDHAIKMRKLSAKIRQAHWKRHFAYIMQPVTVPGNNNTSMQSYALFRTYYKRSTVFIKYVYEDSFDIDVSGSVCVPSLDSLCYFSLSDNGDSIRKRTVSKGKEIQIVTNTERYTLQTKAPVMFYEYEPDGYGVLGNRKIDVVYRNMYSKLVGTKYTKDKSILTPEDFNKISIMYTS